MSERNGPGGMKTERRSPMITSGVAAPSVASNNIAVVSTTAATNPASNPARIAFVWVTMLPILPPAFLSHKRCSARCPQRILLRRQAVLR
jgi:hypothetical protein